MTVMKAQKLYKVKLAEDSHFNPNQNVDGYLGDRDGTLYPAGTVMEYTRGHACRKAHLFNGKIEFSREVGVGKFYLFGEEAVNFYEQDWDELIDEIRENGLGYEIYEFDPSANDPSGDLLSAYDGWGNFTEITKEEYNQIQSIN